MRSREVAQFGSALRSGRRGRGFKSPLPDKGWRRPVTVLSSGRAIRVLSRRAGGDHQNHQEPWEAESQEPAPARTGFGTTLGPALFRPRGGFAWLSPYSLDRKIRVGGRRGAFGGVWIVEGVVAGEAHAGPLVYEVPAPAAGGEPADHYDGGRLHEIDPTGLSPREAAFDGARSEASRGIARLR
jgi:hypothetical protein